MTDDESKRPKVGIAVFIYRDSKFLMIKRHGSHGAGTWSVPGGHLEFGESWDECIRREAMEEVGVELTHLKQLCITNDIFASEGKHSVTIWMTADWAGNEPSIKEPHKILGIQWHTFADLPEPLFEPCWQNLRNEKPELFI
jgi:8-oxo-dGTP diphosphatase